MKESKSGILKLALFFLIALIITYSNHFDNGFHFDDSHTIVENVHIQSLKNIPEFFHNPQMFSSKPDHWGLRPLVTTTLAFDYWLGGGLNPFYFHLSIFISFVFLCGLLYFIYKRLFDLTLNYKWTSYFAMFAVAWYAFHPANAETINYIISMSDVLSTLFIVISFATYIFYPALRKYYLYIIPAIIGVFAKETVLMLVPILFFYVLFFEKKISLPDLFRWVNFKTVLNTVLHFLPLFIALIAVQYYTFSKAPANPTGFTNPIFYYILTQSYVWIYYFLTFFLPLKLSADTDWAVFNSISDERVIAGLIFVTILVITIVRTSRKQETRGISFGLLWFVFALLPTSIAPLAEVMNDHRMFFPFIGLAFSCVSLAALLIKKYEKKLFPNHSRMMFFRTFLFVVLAAYAYGTYQRNKVWHDDESLWYDVTVKSPKNGRGLMHYGLTQMSKANYDVAKEYFEKALVHAPRYYVLEINLGILNYALKKPVEAEAHYKKAISLMPGLFEPYYYYGDFLRKNNRLQEAKAMGEKAQSISPYFLENRYMLMNIYQKLEEWSNLEKTANATLQFSPANTIAKEYLEASKRKVSTLDSNIIAATNNPTAENYLNLSLEFYNKGMYQKCIDACNEALKLKPNYAEAYSNICAAYNNLKQWDKAIEACNSSLKINPNSTLAKNNLKWAQSQHK